MTLLLERTEVEGLLDMGAAIQIVEAAFIEHSKGMVVSWPPTPFPITKGSLRIAVGALLGSAVIGTRLGLSSAFNSGSLLAVVHDLDSGKLLAVMSYPFTSFRMGAVCALATKLLAREDAEAVGLIGSGRRAISLLEGIMQVRHIERIKVFSREPQRRNHFAEQASSILGLSVHPANHPEDLVEESDVIVVSTNSEVPVFEPQMIRAGMHINSMGLISELHPEIYRRADLIATGSRHRGLSHQAVDKIKEYLPNVGEARFSENIVELSQVMHQDAGRRSKEEITVYRDGTAGWVDLALANWVLKHAMDCGLGKTVSF